MKRIIGISAVVLSVVLLVSLFAVFGRTTVVLANETLNADVPEPGVVPATAHAVPTRYELSVLAVIDRDAYLDEYLALTPDEKSQVWREKFLAVLTDDARTWSAQQIDSLIEVYGLLTPELFAESSEINVYLPRVEDWADRALQLFAPEDFDRIARDLRDLEPAVSEVQIEIAATRYCSCSGFPLSALIDCRPGQGCASAECVRLSGGCGLFGILACTGICATPGGPVEHVGPAEVISDQPVDIRP